MTVLDGINTGVQVTGTVLSFLPSLVQAIKELEALFGPKTGSTKKAVLMAGVADQPPEVQQAVSTTVDKLVPIVTPNQTQDQPTLKDFEPRMRGLLK